jgi:hypothetical protein
VVGSVKTKIFDAKVKDGGATSLAGQTRVLPQMQLLGRSVWGAEPCDMSSCRRAPARWHTTIVE